MLVELPDQFQGGTAEADRTVHGEGRTRGGSSHNEGGGIFHQHDLGAGLQGELRQHVAVHRQHMSPTTALTVFAQSASR